MYLSRVQVNTNDHQIFKHLTHLCAYHDWVERSFPREIAAGTRLRHLWRLDSLNGRDYLLVLSPDAPELAQLARYGVAGTAQTKDYDPFVTALRQGQRLRFRLTANPTRAIATPGQRGHVAPHVTVAQQMAWLSERAAALGFELPIDDDGPQFQIVGRDYPALRRAQGKPVRLSRVSFEGTLVVSDLVRFKETLATGIGREKAFGMGLLTVIPEAW
ncbi:type I-E CRISPR-associated protein Cas6/Cse3/CasE [Lacticaseibacillus paracasei]|uniref:type I-E CRISPR-associated protein Cas6/Cse3/CasE n=1 Tax=Lacticaseibacillus paracasei TaxID=1597 RepID=UPI0033905A35